MKMSDVVEIEVEIRKLGQIRATLSLQEYIGNIHIDKLTNLIRCKINSSSFECTWNYILQGFNDSPESKQKRYEVVGVFLKELENCNLPVVQINYLLSRLCMELSKFKNKHLISLCELCLEGIQSKNVEQQNWKDLLPELLNIVSERDEIKLNEENLTGIQYKSQFINSLCMLNWSPNVLISLTSMFIDVTLTKDEHLKIVLKLGQYIEKLSPQELPPFIYQLLKLCKNYNFRPIVLKLQHYFGIRIYEKVANWSESSNDESASDLNAIEECDKQNLIEAEGTILYYIHSSALLGHNGIDEYICSLKNLLRAPEFILHPFQLTVLFTISTISHYEEKIFDKIRSCVSRALNEQEKMMNLQFFKEMLPKCCKIDSVLHQIISKSLNGREFVLQGLINFGFKLLSVGSALGRDLIAEQQWHLGKRILLKIAKDHQNMSCVIIQKLCNRIVCANQNVTQFIECLHIIAKKLPLLLLENQSSLIELMDSLVETSSSTAIHLVDVIIPLSKISPTIKNHFILLLRKALYSRNIETRQIAVIGYLKLLKNLKITNLVSLSQSSGCSFSSSSGQSILSQISLSRVQTTTTTTTSSSSNVSGSFSNEALCLELLDVLKRCFMQQAEVRAQLYDGLFDAVCLNLELGIPVLNMLWYHFAKFYLIDSDIKPPFKFNEIIHIKDVDVVLQEPLAKLIFAMSLILNKILLDGNNENSIILKIQNSLNSCTKRMYNCELIDFEFDNGFDYFDQTPESQEKLICLKETISIYESLIAFKLIHESDDNYIKDIQRLFEGYYKLINFTKTLSKQPKLKSKKAEQAASTEKTTANSKIFKIPETILNLKVLIKALHLLLMADNEDEQNQEIKSIREIHQYFLHAIATLLNSLKNKKQLFHKNNNVYEELCEIAEILYKKVINKGLIAFIEFDLISAQMVLECFHGIFSIISTMEDNNHFKGFLAKLSEKNKEEDLIVHLGVLFETYQKLFDEIVDLQDSEMKKIQLVLIQTIALIVNQTPNQSNSLSLQIMECLKNYALNNNHNLNGKTIVNSFINLLFDCCLKFKISLNLIENISLNIADITGVIDDDEQQQQQQSQFAIENFKILNQYTIETIFQALCCRIKTFLEDIDWMIGRLKAEYNILTYPGEETNDRKWDYLKNRERDICWRLCVFIRILRNICNSTIPCGNLTEAIAKNLTILFATLTNLTKYFQYTTSTSTKSKPSPSYQHARFERVVKLAGKQLAPMVYKFILYIEGISNQKTTTLDTKQLKNKVLKDTRLIPKVVYEMEQFSKSIIQLTNKTNIDLAKYMGQGTVRDFRIKAAKLKEALDKEQKQQSLDDSTNSFVTDDNENENQNPPDADQILNELQQQSQTSQYESDEEQQQPDQITSSSSSSPPPTKKCKF